LRDATSAGFSQADSIAASERTAAPAMNGNFFIKILLFVDETKIILARILIKVNIFSSNVSVGYLENPYKYTSKKVGGYREYLSLHERYRLSVFLFASLTKNTRQHFRFALRLFISLALHKTLRPVAVHEKSPQRDFLFGRVLSSRVEPV